MAEVQVVTNRFDATQGHSSGQQLNAITKSGTNTPQGTFSGYFRDDKFNAKDFIANRVLPYLEPAARMDLRRPDRQGQAPRLRLA